MISKVQWSAWTVAATAGAAVLAVHTGLALSMFAQVHSSTDPLAGFGWFFFMSIDYPTTVVAWEYAAHAWPVRLAYEWGNTWGDGRNLRALIVHGLLGGLHWFAIGWAAGLLLSSCLGGRRV